MPNPALSRCHAHILSPEIFARFPAAMQANWAFAKEAQGRPITPERMKRLEPRHAITGPGRVRTIGQAMPATRSDAQAIERKRIDRLIADVCARRLAMVKQAKAPENVERRPTETKGASK